VQLFNAVTRALGIIAVFSVAVAFGTAGSAAAANANSQLLCFDGTTDTANGDTDGAVYGGICTRTSNGATLNNLVAGPDGQYSGVYYETSTLAGKTLGQVTQLSFRYTGAATAGSPRISLPIDVTGDGTTDFYAFIGAFYCNNGAGLVDAINDETCTIFVGSESFANWDALVAAHPTWHIGAIPFVIADDVGFWTVSDVHLGETVATGDKNDCKKGGWEDLEREDGSSFRNQGDCIQYMNTGK
jgi:hypothetical protein